MSITQAFFRIWNRVMLPLVVGVTLIAYFSLPGDVAVHHDATGSPDQFLSKDKIFYWSVATVLVVFVLFNLLASSLERVLVLKANTTNVGTAWAKGLQAAIYTTIFLFQVALIKINGNKGQILSQDFKWVFIISALLIMAVLAYLPYKLLQKSDKG